MSNLSALSDIWSRYREMEMWFCVVC